MVGGYKRLSSVAVESDGEKREPIINKTTRLKEELDAYACQ